MLNNITFGGTIMDLKFMWYANATVINTIMPQHKRYDDVYNITVLQKDIKDKYMKYTVVIGEEQYRFNYTFFSNVCVAGSLEIIDCQRGKPYTYAIERNNDSVRLYTDLENYSELYLYEGSTLIDIQVNSCRKSFISCMNIQQTKEREYSVNVIRAAITDEHRSRFDYSLKNQLFTVTGAVDYNKMVCFDVVSFSDRSSQMVIYTEEKCQLVTIHSFNQDHISGKVQPINADFNEYIEYKKIDTGRYLINEFILNNSDHPFLKRSYELYNQPDGTIRVGSKQFQITHKNNDVVFQLL